MKIPCLTRLEIEELLPQVEVSYRTILSLKAQISVVYHELECFGYAPRAESFQVWLKGASRYVNTRRGVLKALIESLKDIINELHASGCRIRDLDEGQFDWLSKDSENNYVRLLWTYGKRELVAMTKKASESSSKQSVSTPTPSSVSS